MSPINSLFKLPTHRRGCNVHLRTYIFGGGLSQPKGSDGLRTKKIVNGTTTEYTYASGLLVSQSDPTTTLNFTYSADGIPRAVTYEGTQYYYFYNLQGDVVAIYDSQGSTQVKYTYDTWGKLISVTGTMASTLGAKNPFRYRGYVYDTETGFYYLATRYYDPETGRFLNADGYISTGETLTGYNMFAYCYNNPVMYIDKFGCSPSSLLQTVRDVIVIMVSVSAIESYITKNNIGALYDYADRTTDDDTTLTEFANNLAEDKDIVLGNFKYNKLDTFSNIVDVLQITGKALPAGAGEMINAITVVYDTWLAYRNPLVYTHDIGVETAVSAIGVLVGGGLVTFSAELATSVGLISKNPVIGVASGLFFYTLSMYLINELNIF